MSDESTPIRPSTMVVEGMTAPDFRAPTNKGQTLSPEAFTDRLAVVLVFLDPLDTPGGASGFWAFDASLPEFGSRRVQLLGVASSAPRELREQTEDRSLTLLADEDGSIRAAFGVDPSSSAAVVIDRHGTVAAVLTEADALRPPAVLDVVDRLLVQQPDALEAHPSGPTEGEERSEDPSLP